MPFCQTKKMILQFVKFLQGRESWIYDSRSTRTFTP